MTRVQVSVEIDAPVEDVWKEVADPRNLPKWDRHIAKVKGVPDDGLEVGAEYTTEVRFMGVGGRIDAVVLEIEPPTRSRIKLSGFLDATVDTKLMPLGDRRTKLEHTVDYRFGGGPLGSLAAQGVRLTGGPGYLLRRGTLAQKRQVEGT